MIFMSHWSDNHSKLGNPQNITIEEFFNDKSDLGMPFIYFYAKSEQDATQLVKNVNSIENFHPRSHGLPKGFIGGNIRQFFTSIVFHANVLIKACEDKDLDDINRMVYVLLKELVQNNMNIGFNYTSSSFKRQFNFSLDDLYNESFSKKEVKDLNSVDSISY